MATSYTHNCDLCGARHPRRELRRFGLVPISEDEIGFRKRRIQGTPPMCAQPTRHGRSPSFSPSWTPARQNMRRPTPRSREHRLPGFNQSGYPPTNEEPVTRWPGFRVSACLNGFGRLTACLHGTMGGMNVTLRYTQLGLVIASLLDKEEPLDAGQAQQYIEDRSLFSWLGRRYDGEIDLSLYGAGDQADVLERFQALSDTVDTGRTFGIERNGLALLAAYCFEVLQEIHYFKEPS
jgi:hypothetical protein